jgi:hypothetical protein
MKSIAVDYERENKSDKARGLSPHINLTRRCAAETLNP